MCEKKAAVLVLYSVCLIGSVFGVTTWKGGVSGYWDTPANWAGGFPVNTSTVRLNHDRQTNTYAVIVKTPAIADKLWIDTYGDVPIHFRVSETGSLQLNSMRMGFKEEDRESSFTIDGGTVWGLDPVDPAVTNTAFLIGNNPDCEASLSVVNDGLFSVSGSNGLIIASSKESSGHLIVTNGNLRIRDSLILGKGPASHGEMILTGTSSVSITGALHIAKLDNGALMPTGTVFMSGGTLDCGSLNVGAHGNGSLILNAGDIHTGTGGVTIGLSNADGRLDIHGGILQAANSFMNIGHTDSSGLLSISNGMVHISGPLRVGSGSRGYGQINQSGGSLSVNELIIGEPVSATGILNLYDGTLTSTNLLVGLGGTAQCNLYGGTLSIQGTGTTDFQVSNSCIHIQQTVIQWANSNVTDWITNAIDSGIVCFSNGIAPGTYSTNGYDGRIVSETASLYWDNLDNGSQFGLSAIWVEQLPAASAYDSWAADYELSESGLMDDPDDDGLDNLSEYALGGDPTNDNDAAILPTFGMTESGGSNWFEFVYRKRTDADAVGLDYYLELSTNLFSGTWTNEGYLVTEPGGDHAVFEIITNRIPAEPFTELFIRLRISAE
ncbi:hypothetical protein P4B35_21135 [Pontiellaceae bacterium B12227]|nr:hypothetical protein [Pontiellaceae bacterium B12227]